MTRLVLRLRDREIELDLKPGTLETVLWELRESDATLAGALELAVRGGAPDLVTLKEGDSELLVIAAQLALQTHLIDDPALETLATL